LACWGFTRQPAMAPGSNYWNRCPLRRPRRLRGRSSGATARLRLIHAVIEWFGDMRAKRPAFAVLLVTDHRFGATLASCPHPVRAVVRPSDLVAGGLPRVALDQLRAASVEGRVLDRLVLQFGGALLEHMPLVRGLVAHAVRGGTVSAAVSDLDISVDTVRRRLTAAGVPPRDFMRAARVLAYEERRRRGASAPTALAACGWTDPEHLRRARRRNELR
jgi:hypothetical protein